MLWHQVDYPNLGPLPPSGQPFIPGLDGGYEIGSGMGFAYTGNPRF
jgi:hypothetical protein